MKQRRESEMKTEEECEKYEGQRRLILRRMKKGKQFKEN